MHRSVVDGERFRHVVYAKKRVVKERVDKALAGISTATAPGSADADRVHIYIEGDGVAWRSRFVISEDPTSRDVLMLDLMAMDSARALYVGRPCYLGRSSDPGCDSSLWTYHRFSDAVVDSMVAAINASLKSDNSALGVHGGKEIVLFGHSGGATLAMLLASRLPQVSTIVTVAGNLDTRAWVKHHRYTPLFGSINPAQQPPLSSNIRQLHLLGGRDKVIPPELVRHWIENQPAASVWQFDAFTHSCCWKQQWLKVLNWVDSGVAPTRSRIL